MNRFLIATSVLIGITIAFLLLFLSLPLRNFFVSQNKHFQHRCYTDKSKHTQKIIQDITETNKRLKTRLDKFTPNEPYLIINSTDNTFTVKKGSVVLRKGLCSTGSYVLLKSHDKKEWIFQTPRGLYPVLEKKESPVWSMPDWAFIEEGRPVPPPGAVERYEHGVLGDYALSLGRGYMIHGTLYQRFLGLPVSHGCIRLGDDDLEFVYKKMRIGSKVYIY